MKLRLLCALALAAANLVGCSFAPPYRPPVEALPVAFKEGGIWQSASPADGAPRGAWWAMFADARLNDIETTAAAANTDLATALARFDAANAIAAQLGATQLPVLTAFGETTRNRQSDDRPLRGAGQPDVYAANTLGIRSTYEIDLWGRIRNAVASGVAQAAAAKDDVESARLSLQAEVADFYFRLRGDDAQIGILNHAVDAYERALHLTERRHDGGITSGLDVARARNQLADARAQLSETIAQRALLEHAIASLTGRLASDFSIPVVTSTYVVPATPVAVPSELLQRRPDIAAAERRMFAANANVGVARSAFYPSIGLSTQVGFQSTGSTLLAAPERFWSIGPSGILPIFDAGLRRAVVAGAEAEYRAAAAQYRGRVISAFQQVEDQLALAHRLAQEAAHEQDAVDAAQQALDIAQHRYTEGAVNYLEVVTAQTALLVAQRNSLALSTRRLLADVDLIGALGGPA